MKYSGVLFQGAMQMINRNLPGLLRSPRSLLSLWLLTTSAALVVWCSMHIGTGSSPLPERRMPDTMRSTAALDSTRITNDGDGATVTVTLRDHLGRPIVGAVVRLRTASAFMTTAQGRTGELGTAALTTTVRSGFRHGTAGSGLVHLAVVDESTHTLLPQPLSLTVYNRVAVLLQGVGTSLDCAGRACIPDMFQPLAVRVLAPLGYQMDGSGTSVLVYSYRGGTMSLDRGLWVWKPGSYDACDTAQPVSRSAQVLRSMLLAYRTRYPYTTFELLGHSLGGLIALQAVGYASFRQQLGVAAVDKVVAVDSPVNGVDKDDVGSWLIDGFAGIRHLHSCLAQRFGIDLAGELSGLADRTPTRQYLWAAAAKAAGTEVLTVANQYDLPVPVSDALPDESSPTSVVDRIRYSLAPFHTIGHSAVLYPEIWGPIDNPDWKDFTSTLRAYLQQSCLAFAPRGTTCLYPMINRGF